jgi:hypothetical protein
MWRETAVVCAIGIRAEGLKKTMKTLKSTIFWDIAPCNPLSVNRHFGGTYRLHLQGRTCRTYFFDLKMEAICSSETLVDTQRTTRRYIPEDGSLYNHRSENVKFYTMKTFIQDRRYADRESNQAPPEDNSESSSPEPTCWV